MNQAETVLVVGADGMIGRTLAERFTVAGRSVVRTTLLPTPGAVAFDLAREAARWKPPPASVAYLCAAITSQEQCRTHRAAARAVNVEGTLALAEKLAHQGTHVIFPSTNLVLDGLRPHQPADSPYAPQTEYGRQKAETEQRLRQLPRTCVVRFTKVLGRATPLLLGWVAALRKGEVIRPFSDMPMAPVPLDFAVEALVAVAAARAEGVVQVSADRDITYAEAARFVADCLTCAPNLVQPVTVAHSGMAITYVPAHTTLDTTRLQREFGLAPPPLWAAITLGMEA
ncbi:MAG: sugar nucleotide-binding protein [Thermoguttaceae bacterium]